MIDHTQLTIRDLDTQQDLSLLAEFFSALRSRQVSERNVEQILNKPFPTRQLMVAVDEAGEARGYCAIYRLETMPQGQFSLWLAVHPQSRRMGIGSQLLNVAIENAKTKWEFTALVTEVSEKDDGSLPFALDYGFFVERSRIRSSMNPLDFDEERLIPLLGQVEAQGIRFLSFENLEDTPEARRRIYEINRLAAQDIPGRGPFFSYEVYVARRFEVPTFCPEGLIVAIDGDEWIGFTQVTDHEDFMFIQMTGVLSHYRGRKVGQVLRLLGIRCAKKKGIASLRTVIDAENQAMLAVNQRTGFSIDNKAKVVKYCVE